DGRRAGAEKEAFGQGAGRRSARSESRPGSRRTGPWPKHAKRGRRAATQASVRRARRRGLDTAATPRARLTAPRRVVAPPPRSPAARLVAGLRGVSPRPSPVLDAVSVLTFA